MVIFHSYVSLPEGTHLLRLLQTNWRKPAWAVKKRSPHKRVQQFRPINIKCVAGNQVTLTFEAFGSQNDSFTIQIGVNTGFNIHKWWTARPLVISIISIYTYILACYLQHFGKYVGQNCEHYSEWYPYSGSSWLSWLSPAESRSHFSCTWIGHFGNSWLIIMA